MRPFLLVVGVLFFGSFVTAQGVQFPGDSRVVDVTTFGAIGDGVADDSAALLAALNAPRPSGAAGLTVYLPDGVYLVSQTIAFPTNRITLQGQSEAGTTIRLVDNAPGFQDPSTPARVLSTREATGFSANHFRCWIRDLTVDSGAGNPGAVGVLLHQNNTGGMRDVTIRSGDPGRVGVMGLDLLGSDRGPGLLTDVTVDGFDVGVGCGGTEYGLVFERLTLTNQLVVGLNNTWNLLSIRGLTSVNAVPALRNNKATANDFRWGVVVIVGASLTGGAPGVAAIENEAALYLRDVTTAGYLAAVSDRGVVLPGASQAELALPRPEAVFASPASALGLPILDTPGVPADPPATWANVESFGADGTSAGDDAAGIQAAIDSGATTIYFPAGSYQLGTTVELRSAARRFVFFESNVAAIAPLAGTGAPLFDCVAGTAPVVVMERAQANGGSGPGVRNSSNRTLVIRNGSIGSYVGDGPGRTFVEDLVSGPWEFRNGHQAWARQLNPENSGTKVIVDAADLWLLGIKTEKQGTIIVARNGARVELLGGLIYPVGTLPLQQPMFVNDEASMSLALGESAYGGASRRHEIIVEETRGGEVRRLWFDEIPRRVGFGLGAQLALYRGFLDPMMPTPSPAVAEYSMDAIVGATLPDDSGNGRDGALFGAASVSGGLSGAALSFDGVDDHATLPTGFLGSDEGSVSVWVNTSQDFTENGMIVYGTSSTSGLANGGGAQDELHLEFRSDETVGLFIEGAGGDLGLNGEAPLADGQWHHVAATWSLSRGYADLYVDGRRRDFRRGAWNSFSFTGALRLGRPNAPTRWYAGLIDELKLFDRALDHAEVLDLYNGGLTFPNYPPAVDAGIPLAVQDASYSIALEGQVYDDGQPTTPLLVTWSQTAGPGTVSFADASDPITAATFSQAGQYVLTLTADDGAVVTADSVTVDVYDPLPLPWVNQDVGATGAFGWTEIEPLQGGFVIHGSGTRIAGNPQSGGDGFHFVWQPIDGSQKRITARIAGFTSTDPDGRAGVMYRTGFGGTSANAFVGYAPGQGLIYTNRAGSGGGTATQFNDPLVTPPFWVSLLRTSTNAVSAEWSLDGIAWTSLGSATVNSGGGTKYLGLAVSSGITNAIEVGTLSPVLYVDELLGQPLVRLLQPGGPGSPLTILNENLTPGTETFNVFSLEPCPGLPGYGPLAGLCATDPTVLIDQTLSPPNTPPLRFTPTTSTVTFGPFSLPPSITIDALCLTLPAGSPPGFSPISRITIQ